MVPDSSNTRFLPIFIFIPYYVPNLKNVFNFRNIYKRFFVITYFLSIFCLSFCPFIFVCLSTCLLVYLSTFLFCLPICIFLYLSVCLFVCLSNSICSVFPFPYLSRTSPLWTVRPCSCRLKPFQFK